MNLRLDDTIAALASAAGPAPRGIVRISGPASQQALEVCFRAHDAPAWRAARYPRRHSGVFQLPALGTSVEADVLLWPGARSYTGQLMAEIHTLGSPPVLETVLGELYAQRVRPARPGEFTLRAFLSGRVDLTQAEAVLGVIDAADHVELETALRQLAGGLSIQLAHVRGDLLDLLADIEAGLDFVEEDIEFVEASAVVARLDQARQTLQRLLESADSRMHTTARRQVVLAGLPNAGKSTLFNALIRQDAALVSEVEGTTRDYLSAPLELESMTVDLVDTAGWEDERVGISGLAQALRSERFAKADLLVWCTPAGLSSAERRYDRALIETLQQQGRPVLCVVSKADLPDSPAATGEIGVSARLGTGLPELARAISIRLSEGPSRGGHLLGTTAARCGETLRSAVQALEAASVTARSHAGEELVALEIREALEHLGVILGTVYTDDILDRIFSKFCIGK